MREGERRAYNCKPLQSWWALADRVWSGTFVDTSPAPLCITEEIELKNKSLEKTPKPLPPHKRRTAPCTHQTPSHTTIRLPRETCNMQHAPRKSAVHRAPRTATSKVDKGQTFHSAGGPSGTLSYSVPEITRDKREIGEKTCRLTPNMMRQGVTYLGKHPTRVVSINCRPFRAFIIHPGTHAKMTLAKRRVFGQKKEDLLGIVVSYRCWRRGFRR